jgi:hypothetical protein
MISSDFIFAGHAPVDFARDTSSFRERECKFAKSNSVVAMPVFRLDTNRTTSLCAMVVRRAKGRSDFDDEDQYVHGENVSDVVLFTACFNDSNSATSRVTRRKGRNETGSR